MWKRSWLSREVLLFSSFSGIAFVYSGLLWLNARESWLVGGVTVITGLGGVAASGCIYLVRARPAWRTKHTLAEFYLTAALLGPLFVATLNMGQRRWLVAAEVVAAALQLLNFAVKFLRLVSSGTFELAASAKLLSGQLRTLLLIRMGLLILGGIAMPLHSRSTASLAAAFGVAVLGEILGRYLFFTSVVPKNMAASYLSVRKAAA
jgi:DMSO reductase anchor subunit